MPSSAIRMRQRRDHVRYRVALEHRENYIIEASCAAEAQYIAADFALQRGNSEFAGHVLEHADESLHYECTQLEPCQHTPALHQDHIDA